MATAKQRSAALLNIKKAAAAARRKGTLTRLPAETRKALGKEGAKTARRRRGEATVANRVQASGARKPEAGSALASLIAALGSAGTG
jgi:hypothetical protein